MGGKPFQAARRWPDENSHLVEEPHDDLVAGMGLVDDPEGLFNCFYEEYRPRLRGFARRFRDASNLADDLVQEVLLRAYRAGIHLQPERDPWPWLSTVCRNLTIDVGRRRDFRSERCVDADFFTALPAPDRVIDDPVVVSMMTGGEVTEALAQLDQRQRRILILKHVRGWKYEELAEWEGISFAALRSALGRARQRFVHAYVAVVEGRGVPALVGSVFGVVARRFRTLRGRTAGGEAALAQQLGVATPGLANAVTAAVTLGAVAVVGSFFGLHGTPQQTPNDQAFTAPAESRTVRVVSVSSPEASDAVSADPPVEPVEPVGLISTTPSTEPDREEVAKDPPPGTTVAVDESGASAEAEGQRLTFDRSVEKTDDPESDRTNYTTNPLSGEGDRDGDGEADSTTGTPGGISCPPPDERGPVSTGPCLALDASGAVEETTAP